MATSEQHIRQWKHNRTLLPFIPLNYPDWIVTITFYVALQAVDTLLAFDHVPRIHSHEARNKVLMVTKRYSFISRRYLTLHDLARTVRYLVNPAGWVPADQIEKEIFGELLYPIEKSVQNLIKMDLNLPKLSLARAASQ